MAKWHMAKQFMAKLRIPYNFTLLFNKIILLKETLAREKLLEEKLLKVKGMISKNIGKSHTDLLRIFEDVKEELMNIYQERELLEYRSENDNYEKVSV